MLQQLKKSSYRKTYGGKGKETEYKCHMNVIKYHWIQKCRMYIPYIWIYCIISYDTRLYDAYQIEKPVKEHN